MDRREFGRVIGAAAIAPTWLAQKTQPVLAWSLEANLAECCSCEIPCPCNFGLSTPLRCDGNRLIEIYKGQVRGLDLTGVRFVVTFEMGKWARIYADENMSVEQMKAFDAILPLAFGFFASQSRSTEPARLAVARTRELITFSTPESEVEMIPLAGLNGGLITVDGLPYNTFHDYVQYQSVRHIHNGPERQWSYAGTNGFTSSMIASG